MPSKYGYDIWAPDRIVGMAHRVLFVLCCALGLACALRLRWTLTFSALVFLASLVRFGTFCIEARYLKPMAER